MFAFFTDGWSKASRRSFKQILLQVGSPGGPPPWLLPDSSHPSNFSRNHRFSKDP